MKRASCSIALAGLLLFLVAMPARAENTMEKAGEGVALTAGNLVFLPAKGASMVFGAIGGALWFLFTGGDTEVTRQVMRDTSSGPYFIDRALAKKSIGERPLLTEGTDFQPPEKK